MPVAAMAMGVTAIASLVLVTAPLALLETEKSRRMSLRAVSYTHLFVVLAIGSAAFAKHLHLFEPVLRHHYNKRTHEDELVTPDDPAFKQEEQAAEERKEERHHKL